MLGRNHKTHKILKKGATRSTASVEESTENTDHTEKGLHVERDHGPHGKGLHVRRKPQNTPNTQKSATRNTASVGRVHGKHGPHGKRLHVGRDKVGRFRGRNVGRDVGLPQPHTPRQD